MSPAAIARRIFLVPLADNEHGKSTLMRSFVNQAERRFLDKPQKGRRELLTPWGRPVDALIFIRSYQEKLLLSSRDLEAALDTEDAGWRSRDLLVMPSHIDVGTCRSAIRLAHTAGFDAVVAPVLREESELYQLSQCLGLGWDERWTLRNPTSDRWQDQAASLGSDLWTWTSKALTRQ